MPTDPQQVLADPKFQALPLKERLKVMRTIDPRFAVLPAKEQGTVLYHAAERAHPTPTGEAGPEDAGFLSTFLGDIFHLPELTDLIPGVSQAKQVMGVARGAIDTGKRAYHAAQGGDYLDAGLHGLLSLVPGIGPVASQAGEEYQLGQPGQGTAHALEAILPFALPSIAGAAPRGSTLRSIGRGVAEGAKAAPGSVGLTTALEALGLMTDHPAVGTTAAAVSALPKIMGGLRGGLRGFAERDMPPMPERGPAFPIPKVDIATSPGNPPPDVAPTIQPIPVPRRATSEYNYKPEKPAREPKQPIFPIPKGNLATSPGNPVIEPISPVPGGFTPEAMSSLPKLQMVGETPAQPAPVRSTPGQRVDTYVEAKDANLIDYLKSQGVSRAKFVVATTAEKNAWLKEAGKRIDKQHKPWKDSHDPSGESLVRLLDKWKE